LYCKDYVRKRREEVKAAEFALMTESEKEWEIAVENSDYEDMINLVSAFMGPQADSYREFIYDDRCCEQLRNSQSQQSFFDDAGIFSWETCERRMNAKQQMWFKRAAKTTYEHPPSWKPYDIVHWPAPPSSAYCTGLVGASLADGTPIWECNKWKGNSNWYGETECGDSTRCYHKHDAIETDRCCSIEREDVNDCPLGTGKSFSVDRRRRRNVYNDYWIPEFFCDQPNVNDRYPTQFLGCWNNSPCKSPNYRLSYYGGGGEACDSAVCQQRLSQCLADNVHDCTMSKEDSDPDADVVCTNKRVKVTMPAHHYNMCQCTDINDHGYCAR
jgi:hypothetical protein